MLMLQEKRGLVSGGLVFSWLNMATKASVRWEESKQRRVAGLSLKDVTQAWGKK